jgi:multiple sugar transport system substrate-binding protein
LLAQQGQPAPVTDVIKEIGQSDFDPVGMVQYKSDLWYFPYIYNFCALCYRQDWLDEAKFAIPTNWAEFTEVTKAFTVSAKRRFGTSLPYSMGLTPWGNSGFLWSGGVKFYDDNWNVLLDASEIKPKLARALDMLASINGYNAPGQYSMTLLNIITNFITGTAGVVGQSGSVIQDINQRAADLDGKFVLAPYPAPDGGKGTVVYGSKGIGIGKSANTAAALDFLRWFVKSGKLIDFQLTLPMYVQPVQFSTYSNPKWLNDAVIRKNWPAMQTMKGFLDHNAVNLDAVQLQGPRITESQGMIVNDAVIMHMYQNVLSKKMSIDDAIADAAAQVRKLTARSRGAATTTFSCSRISRDIC